MQMTLLVSIALFQIVNRKCLLSYNIPVFLLDKGLFEWVLRSLIKLQVREQHLIVFGPVLIALLKF